MLPGVQYGINSTLSPLISPTQSTINNNIVWEITIVDTLCDDLSSYKLVSKFISWCEVLF